MRKLRTLPEALAEAACTDEGYVFVVNGVETRRSYAAIREASLGVARALRDAGVRRGDLVAVVIGDAQQFLTTFFGASIAGAIPASVYPPATSGDLTRYMELTGGILRAANARVVVTTSALRSGFEKCSRAISSMRRRSNQTATRRSTISPSCSSRRDPPRRRKASR